MLFFNKSIASKISIGVSLLFAIALISFTYINYIDSRDNSIKLLSLERQKAVAGSENILDIELEFDANKAEQISKQISKRNLTGPRAEVLECHCLSRGSSRVRRYN